MTEKTESPITKDRGDSAWQEARERNKKLHPNSYHPPALTVRWLTSGRKVARPNGKIGEYQSQPPYVIGQMDIKRGKKAQRLKTREAAHPSRKRESDRRKREQDEAVCQERMLAVLAKRTQRAITADKRREARAKQ